MSEKVYLNLLFLFGIFSHIIVAISSNENITTSSDLLLRKRRVLNRETNGDVSVRIKDFPYVVLVKKSNRMHCVGSILSQRTVITAATCVTLDLLSYTVTSGVIRTSRGRIHQVTGMKTHFSSNLPRTRVRDGVALITVDPPFVYSAYTFHIELHHGLLLPNTLGTVAGWGYLKGPNPGTRNCETLRAIDVPIMSHRECANMYRHYANITEKEICTFHVNKFCGHTDIGAALVINNQMVGIHLWGGQIVNYNKPDVFLLVQDLEFSNWIRANIV